MDRHYARPGEIHQMPFLLHMLTVFPASALASVGLFLLTDSVGVSEVFKKI